MTCFGGACPWLKHGKCTSLYMPSPANPRAVVINPNFNTVVSGRVVECTQHMAIISRFELRNLVEVERALQDLKDRGLVTHD